ncbi:Tat pathway signal sequence domain protein [Streptomyces sp. NPDC052013]|uniref:Tat pathway signal sequence domain protein n=1 Tax=Streptomyces sp. NPDC052013 TaxID=3365679 RepID=UPI0037CFCC35
MSGIGPVEPGDGTQARDTAPPLPRGPQLGPLSALYGRHRRAALATLTTAAVLAGTGYLYATRPEQPAPVPPPYPSQVTVISYLKPQATPPGTEKRNFRFTAELSVESGPPVTVTRISQPYEGLSVISSPRTPFRTKAGAHRKIMITLRVTECGKVPGSAGLPFLDVTLRNTRAIQVHSFILGSRYAQDLSQALQVACSNDSG